MTLDVQAANPIVGAPVALTCHVAVWYWAALEAQALGLLPARPLLTRLGNIAGIPTAPQPAMLALARSGKWNFNLIGNPMPPDGTVLLWTTGATHSAVATPAGITGYNQPCVFTPFITVTGHSTGAPSQLRFDDRTCETIAAATVVNAAAAYNL